MWNWYEWESQADFDSWHETLKDSLGYPLVGLNQATNEPDLTNLTVDYTGVNLVDGKFIGVVENKYAQGLTPTDIRPKPPIRDL